MPAKTPEEMHRVWSEAFNSNDVEALLALYEPGATLIPQPGQPVTGAEAIRQAVTAFFAMKPRIDLRAKTIVKAGDLALIYGAWTLKSTGPDGRPAEMTGNSVEVLRRQADGTWRYVIDDPYGG